MPVFASVMAIAERLVALHWYHAAGFIAVLAGLFKVSAIEQDCWKSCRGRLESYKAPFSLRKLFN